MRRWDATVVNLVEMIERGELRLPEMQRRFVWTSTRVRDLLDSLYREYPSGSILLWETEENVPVQDFAIVQQENSYQTHKLLLDGQQRLTSLAAVIRGKPVTVRGRKKPIDILFNLNHPENLSVVTEVNENMKGGEGRIEDETDSSEDELRDRFEQMAFVVSNKTLEKLPNWVKVSAVFNADDNQDILRNAGIQGWDDPRFNKFNDRLTRLRRIRDYTYRVNELERALSYDEVTEIFVRVNSLGVKLRGSDLALAQISAKWGGSLKIFQAFQEECKNDGFNLDLGIFLRNLVAFATEQSRFHTVGRLTKEELEIAWTKSKEGMHFAKNFLKNNAKIDSPALLSSPYLMVALANYGYKFNFNIDSNESRELKRWVLLANGKGRYSRGSSETLLDRDLAVIRQGGRAVRLLEQLRQQVGRLEIEPEELEGRNQRSAIFKTMFLAFRESGAKDWHSNINIALDHSGAQHRLQFHHIFPKGYLKKNYVDREVNDIANLAFIGARTNRKISDGKPTDYFKKIISKSGTEPFIAQCIPTDVSFLTKEKYKDFLTNRRKLISERLNSFLGNT